MEPFYRDSWVMNYCGDALKVLPEIPDQSIDELVTDPPYGISFMGKDWDKALPDKEIWRQCLRVLKPGAFAFIMSIPRADCLSRMIISLEDAGFWVNFTPIFWAYASGFPKAQNIGKAVDKKGGKAIGWFGKWLKDWRTSNGISQKEIAKLFPSKTGGLTGCVANWELGLNMPTPIEFTTICRHFNLPFETIEEAEREVVGRQMQRGNIGYENQDYAFEPNERFITKPTTPQAKALDGSYGGFQPKPAVEVIIVAMKPLSERTFVEQALNNRKGISWLDEGRIPYELKDSIIAKNPHTKRANNRAYSQIYGEYQGSAYDLPSGRFPANLLVSDDVLDDGNNRVGFHTQTDRQYTPSNYFGADKFPGIRQGFNDSGSFSRYFDLDRWFVEKVKLLPKSAQKTFPFLIVPKASKGEKNRWLSESRTTIPPKLAMPNSPDYLSTDGCRRSGFRNPVSNTHPTVKPLKLISYLITLGSREGDTVLDPFVGSGTTCVAGKILNRKVIAVEVIERYCEIAAKRCSQEVMNLA